VVTVIEQNKKELGALLSWALRNGFCAHVSTEGSHIIVLAKADRQTTRIAHIRDRQSTAAALLINNKRTHILRPATVAAHRYGDITSAAQFLKGLTLIDTTLIRRPYSPPRIDGVNPLYVTEEEEATMGIYGPSNDLRVVHRGHY
jgi:hypothetical protein